MYSVLCIISSHDIVALPCTNKPGLILTLTMYLVSAMGICEFSELAVGREYTRKSIEAGIEMIFHATTFTGALFTTVNI